MPCMELFEAQPPDYRDSVIPRDVPARLAVEAGVSMSWWKWVGDHGEVIGIDRFGASAPGTTVLESLASRRTRSPGEPVPCSWHSCLPEAVFCLARRVQTDLGRSSSTLGHPNAPKEMTERPRCQEPNDLTPSLSPLHRLSALGQSVWIDSLSRETIRRWSPAELIDDDAVVGATSNPTIFQKAMSSGDAYDEQLRELGHRDSCRPSGRWPSRTSPRPATSSARYGSGGSAATATSRWRSTRAWPMTRLQTFARRSACTRQ